ncbi:uncharacterized protein LOC135832461 [Planococcus citri]|uniref:uncharacterized protein LOC135832461 n=1 Tax=Planococcus citri TaxID=170843 RepID=UPI0031F7F974
MHSIKIVCLVLCCLQCFVTVKSEIKPQLEAVNSTSAEDRKDVQWKKPPRKRGTFSFSFPPEFGHGFHSKSLSHFKKELGPTLVEKYVPVPVHVKIPVDRPVPVHVPKLYPVPVEKPVPVPIKISVPQPYPVYKKVAVPVKVPVDRPVPVQVPKPYPVYVEKQVPYPVDKPVPVPVKVPVDRPYPVYVAVEKPVEKPMQIKWQTEKPMSMAMNTGSKSMLWFEKPDTPFVFKEEPDNEKMVSSWFELPEQSESAEISWPPETGEIEIRK